jgi:hypothetical protein
MEIYQSKKYAIISFLQPLLEKLLIVDLVSKVLDYLVLSPLEFFTHNLKKDYIIDHIWGWSIFIQWTQDSPFTGAYVHLFSDRCTLRSSFWVHCSAINVSFLTDCITSQCSRGQQVLNKETISELIQRLLHVMEFDLKRGNLWNEIESIDYKKINHVGRQEAL